MAKTVNDAAELLPESFRKAFIDTFKLCQVMDIYDGEPAMYMSIIYQTLRDKILTVREYRDAVQSLNLQIKRINDLI